MSKSTPPPPSLPSSPTLLRALIIDDEAPARERIAELLAEHPELCPIGEAGAVHTALKLCAELQPDLLFLDIEMGCCDGFSLLANLPPPLPLIIFITAHEEFGHRAFEVDAVDYLLKPVDAGRFAQAVQKLLRFRRGTEELIVPIDRGTTVVALEAITHIEADGNYTRLYQQGGLSLYVRRGIQYWTERLPSERFIRIHRSLIINRQLVKNLSSQNRETGEVQLKGIATPLTLKRRALLRLRRLFDASF